MGQLWQLSLGLNSCNWIYIKDSDKMITYKGVFEVSQSNKTFLTTKCEGILQWQPNFGKNKTANITQK